MSKQSGPVKTGLVYVGGWGLLATLGLFLLSGCSYNPPSPVEEYSTTAVKRRLNSDGTYRVRLGDTLYAIAFDYDVDAPKLAKWNEIYSPYVIYPGQKLRLSAPPVKPRRSGRSTRASTPVAKKSQPTSSKTMASSNKPIASRSGSSYTATDPKNWKWPTSGRVLRGYVAGDPARNGLDIAGREGQPIIASSGGLVVYSGTGLIGYGELIIIKHSEKMLSAYAHNKVRLVKEGAQVSTGQKIAEMGRNTGNQQLLHFEIRVRGKPVNPLAYLPKK